MWFQLLHSFETSPVKMYRQTSCYWPSMSTLPAWFFFNLLWVDQFSVKLRALWGPFENWIINEIRDPFKMHLFFISLTCVRASGFMTCKICQFFFPFTLSLSCLYLPISSFSLQVMDHLTSRYWYNLTSSLPDAPATKQASTDASFSCLFSVLYQTFFLLCC